jgi:cold shock CspA family protein
MERVAFSRGGAAEESSLFSDDKGSGFVTPDEVAEGAKVSYDAEADGKGPRAVTCGRS